MAVLCDYQPFVFLHHLYVYKMIPFKSPLKGIRVVDLSRVLAGPYCATLLSHLGAEVIKVESKQGDEARTWPPFLQLGKDSPQMSAAFLGMNLNKRSIGVDLKSARGIKIVEKLLAKADVLIENFRTGGMERFGLDEARLKELNPRLVQVSISAFGRTGPKGEHPGYEAMVQAYSGAMEITGDAQNDPVRCGVSFLDMSTGVTSAFAAMTALFERERTGNGGRVDTSLLNTAMGLMTMQVSNYMQCGVLQKRLGTAHQSIVPYQSHPTKDGSIFVASANQNLWERLCHVLGITEALSDVRFKDNASRVINREACLKIVQNAMAERSTDDLLQALEKVSIPVSRVNTIKNVMDDGQVQAINAVTTLEGEAEEVLQVSNLPFLMEHSAPDVRMRAPFLGEHTQAILTELGYLPEQIVELLETEVVFGQQ